MARGKKARATNSKPIKRKEQTYDLKLNDKEPDPDDDEFFYDDVDKFHSNREKQLLDEYASDLSFDEDDENEEEVLGYDDSADDDESDELEDDGDSDLENDEEDYNDGIPSNKAWGRKKSSYYGAESLEGLQGLDRDAVQDEEEEEALRIQQRLMDEIDEDQLDLFNQLSTAESEEKAEKSSEGVTTDVSQLSVKAQWKLLKQESPEIKDIINDFKDKSAELTTHLQPLFELVNRNIVTGQGADYITCRYKVTLMYLMNISFYMALKSKRISVRNHPVIKRLVEYRMLINRLQPLDKKLSSEIEELLLQTNAEERILENEKPSIDDEEDIGDQSFEEEEKSSAHRMEAINYYTSLQKRRKTDYDTKQSNEKDEEMLDEEKEEEDDERRAITYKMNKNEGLKGKKRKLDRNPRVKHRERFRKAAIKRKSQVRIFKPEIQKYAGEASGIRAGLVRSVRIR